MKREITCLQMYTRGLETDMKQKDNMIIKLVSDLKNAAAPPVSGGAALAMSHLQAPTSFKTTATQHS